MKDVHSPAFLQSIKLLKYVSQIYFLLTVKYQEEAHRSFCYMLRGNVFNFLDSFAPHLVSLFKK